MNKHIIHLTLLLTLAILPKLQAQDKMTAINLEYMQQLNDSCYTTEKIMLEDNPQHAYSLTLKDGKPYTGFLVSQAALLDEFPYVNLYEKGQIVSQYAVDPSQKAGVSIPLVYSQKSLFKDGKIYEGNQYRQINDSFLLTDHYHKGKKTGLSMDMYAMHAINRYSFQVVGETLEILNPDSNKSVHLYKKDGYVHADYRDHGKTLARSIPRFEVVKEASPLSTTVYYYNTEKLLQQISLKGNPPDTVYIDDFILESFYRQFSFNYNDDIDLLLSTLDYALTYNEGITHGFINLYEKLIVPFRQEELKGFLFYDEDGIISDGVEILKNKKGGYTAKTYTTGELIQEEKIDDLSLYTNRQP